MNANSSQREMIEDTGDLAAQIRGTIRQLDSLDESTSEYLKALAFVLQRVAAADNQVTAAETRRMEKILVDHADLTPAQAVLVVEMAHQRRTTADCGCAYRLSRCLRSSIGSRRRSQILRFLNAVAEADGLVVERELDEVALLVAELGLEPASSC